MYWSKEYAGKPLLPPSSLVEIRSKLNIARTLLFYPISALLNIFCSILQNPLDPRSRSDLDRLKMAFHLTQVILARKLPECEVHQIKLVTDFVVELERLAKCAIDKAWREQSSRILPPT